jgi:hypothetical protein
MRRALSFLLAAVVLPPGIVRSPHAKTDMDTNPANLASAVVTHAFGQLPVYIDAAGFRLLPFNVFRAAEPGRRTVQVYRIVTPRTSLVLDTAITSALTEADARYDARGVRIAVSLDGMHVAHPERYWVFYRNNGPQICRIYFPGDLGSLNMGANTLVLRPLRSGQHRIVVVVRRSRAVLVTRYLVRVLPRAPNARERASAPADDSDPATLGNKPLVLRGSHR